VHFRKNSTLLTKWGNLKIYIEGALLPVSNGKYQAIGGKKI
jgi:hypothetical protein